MLVLRPSELLPGADGVQFYLPAIALAAIFSLPQVLVLLRVDRVVKMPVLFCGLGLVAAGFLAHMTNGELNLAVTDTLMIAKAVLYLVIMLAVLTTPERLRTFLLVHVAASSAMITASVVDFKRFEATWAGEDVLETYKDDRFRPLKEKKLRHVVEFLNIEDDNSREAFFRMRGYGIFADPNDVSLLILSTGIFTLFFLNDRRLGSSRYLFLLNMALLLYAQWCTQSRGGLVSAAIAAVVYLLMRYGRQVGATVALLIAAALPVVAGRLASFSLAGGTGQERIQLWSDGLVQLQTGKIFFGIGPGVYEDVSGLGLKAHNSWIHAFVELGLFGGLFFFGCAFFPALGFTRLRRAGIVPADPLLRRLYAVIPATLAGTCFALCALSRCYTPATYMVFGLAQVYLNMAAGSLSPRRPVVRISQWTSLLCAFWGIVLLLGAFIFVKVFARFG